MIDIAALSTRCSVREMDEADAGGILALCRENPQFYLYCRAKPTMEQVLYDLRALPPGVDPADKHYAGFYLEGRLAAVMDLIDGYPEPDFAFIGFFMVRKALQGRGFGSALVREAEACLKAAGKRAVWLGIDKRNPQSAHFWKKNGFRVLREIDQDGWPVLVAKKTL